MPKVDAIYLKTINLSNTIAYVKQVGWTDMNISLFPKQRLHLRGSYLASNRISPCRQESPVSRVAQNSELIVSATFGVSLGVFPKYTLAAKVPQGAKGATCSWMLWIAQKMKNIVVDRAENETYCCGSRRK